MSDDQGKKPAGPIPTPEELKKADLKNPLVAEVEAVLEPFQVPQKEKERLVALVEARTISMRGSSPLPPPELLKEYDEVVPGLAARMVGWAEEKAKHSRAMDRMIVGGELLTTRIGQVLGFVSVVLLIGAGLYAITVHDSETARWIFGTCIASVASVFVIGKVANWWTQRRGSPQKPELPSPPSEIPAKPSGGKRKR